MSLNKGLPFITQVSIILPLYNKIGFIEQTVRSIQAQSFNEWELIIIDDCSSDGSLDIVEKIRGKDKRISLFRNDTNRGANYCRNLGVNVAQSPYIIFLDADDVLAYDCLKNRLDKTVLYPNFDFWVFTMNIFKKVPGDMDSVWIPNSRNPLAGFLRHNIPWQTSQPLWSKRFVEQIGGFDPSFSRLQDVEFHTRALLQEGVRFMQIPGTPDCYYRVDSSRINFDYYQLLSKYVESAIQFYIKFFPLVTSRGMHRVLLGTVYQIYARLLFGLREGEITRNEFKELEKQLLNGRVITGLNRLKKSLFKAARIANKLPVRIKGLNWVFSKLVEM